MKKTLQSRYNVEDPKTEWSNKEDSSCIGSGTHREMVRQAPEIKKFAHILLTRQ